MGPGPAGGMGVPISSGHPDSRRGETPNAPRLQGYPPGRGKGGDGRRRPGTSLEWRCQPDGRASSQ